MVKVDSEPSVEDKDLRKWLSLYRDFYENPPPISGHEDWRSPYWRHKMASQQTHVAMSRFIHG
jgi:hypothetical protein